MNAQGETVIGLPPGIGDIHWVLIKLESFKRKNNIDKIRAVMNLDMKGRMPEHPMFLSGSKHDYSLEFLKLVPFINSAETVEETIPFEYALAGGSGNPLIIGKDGYDYLIEFNSSLENCIKLADILPEYEPNWDYPLFEPIDSKRKAESLRDNIGGKLILLFTSSKGGNDNWAKQYWTIKDWMSLAKKIYTETKCKPILVGATWDDDYTNQLLELDTERIIYNIVGKTTVADIFAIIREANILIAFNCGLVNMATKFRIPVACFWSIKSETAKDGIFNRDFAKSWLPPWAEDVGYIPFGFGDPEATPDGVFDSIRKYL